LFLRELLGAAQGILEYYGREDVAKLVNRHWAYSLLKRMNFVWHKATTAKVNSGLLILLISRNPFCSLL